MSLRTDLEKKQAKFLTEIKVMEKKLATRKPKKEQADRKLQAAKVEAVKRVEALHAKNNTRLNKEIADITASLALKKKGYLEISAEIMAATPATPERVTVPARTLLATGSVGAPILD